VDERHQSLSKFVIEIVKDSIKEKDEDFETGKELLEEKKELEEELEDTQRDLEVYKKSQDKLEKEVKEFRCDMRDEAMDIYHQIDHDELRKEYEASMPELGIL